MTDLGHVFAGLADVISTLDAVFIESNYDPDMLDKGPYRPFSRKDQGPEGHLSNRESAELLRSASQGNLKWACLAIFQSRTTNRHWRLRPHEAYFMPGCLFISQADMSRHEILCV